MDTTQFILDLIIYVALVAALVAAIWHWPLYKHSTQRWFLFFLIYVAVQEAVAIILPLYGIYNPVVYNIYIIVSFSFYLFWFSLVLRNRKIPYLFLLLFLISVPFSIYFEDIFWEELLLSSFTVGVILVLFCAALYFLELLGESRIVNLHRSQRFWIIAGLLIFNIGFLPLLFLGSILDPYGLAHRIVLTILNVILYGTYTIGFLCLRRN
ncbi:MAG: hypothetical protein AAF489_14305 [Bacteroidota bacterium]